MDAIETYTLARNMMDEFELNNWSLILGRGKALFGLCDHQKRTITISQPLSLINDEPVVRDIVLHEIAHALAGSTAGHGKAWIAIAKSIGCSATRTHSAVTPPPKYIVTCPNCGHQFGRNRKDKNPLACFSCCNKYNSGRFAHEYVLTYRINVDNLAMKM